MKVSIDGELCSGHGRCYVLADEVYDLDDDGYNAHRGSVVPVPEGHEDDARLGAENCPEQAIKLLED
jgi:ferredoxin